MKKCNHPNLKCPNMETQDNTCLLHNPFDCPMDKVAEKVAESHGYVFPCGIEEEDDSFRFWAKEILKVLQQDN